MTGESSEASLSDVHNVFNNVHPDDLPMLIQRITEPLESLKNLEVEVRYFHPVTKKEIWIQISAYPRRLFDYIYADGFVFDITKRKLDEIELHTEKIRLQALSDNIPSGSLYQFVLDVQTGKLRFSYVSAAWESVIGISAEQAMEDINNAFAVIHPDDVLLFKNSINESARTMTTLTFDFRLVNFERTRWVKTGSQPHREGHLIVWDGLLLDITHRKEVEQQLELEKERLETLGNNIPNGSLYRLVFDTKTKKMRITYVSASWEVVTGVDADVALTNITKVFAYIHKEDFPTFLQAINYSA
jgi:PAS domain-containing protein